MAWVKGKRPGRMQAHEKRNRKKKKYLQNSNNNNNNQTKIGGGGEYIPRGRRYEKKEKKFIIIRQANNGASNIATLPPLSMERVQPPQLQRRLVKVGGEEEEEAGRERKEVAPRRAFATAIAFGAFERKGMDMWKKGPADLRVTSVSSPRSLLTDCGWASATFYGSKKCCYFFLNRHYQPAPPPLSVHTPLENRFYSFSFFYSPHYLFCFVSYFFENCSSEFPPDPFRESHEFTRSNRVKSTVN